MIDDTAQLPAELANVKAVDLALKRIQSHNGMMNENWIRSSRFIFHRQTANSDPKLISAPARHKSGISEIQSEGYWNIAFGDKRPIYVDRQGRSSV